MLPYTIRRIPKCMDSSLYNMSSHNVHACLPVQYLINQNVCIPPSTTCHQPTFCVRPPKTCHQLKYLHTSLYNMSSTKVPACLLLHNVYQPTCLHASHYSLQRGVNQSVFISPSTSAINKSVCMSSSTHCYQTKCLHTSVYNNSSTEVSICVHTI